MSTSFYLRALLPQPIWTLNNNATRVVSEPLQQLPLQITMYCKDLHASHSLLDTYCHLPSMRKIFIHLQGPSISSWACFPRLYQNMHTHHMGSFTKNDFYYMSLWAYFTWLYTTMHTHYTSLFTENGFLLSLSDHSLQYSMQTHHMSLFTENNFHSMSLITSH